MNTNICVYVHIYNIYIYVSKKNYMNIYPYINPYKGLLLLLGFDVFGFLMSFEEHAHMIALF